MTALPSLDKEGHIENLADWNTQVAELIASQESVILSQNHWLVIDALRAFYADTDVSPAMRAFVNLVKQQCGEELGNSIALMQLFGESPAKMAAKIAGLPKPTNCL